MSQYQKNSLYFSSFKMEWLVIHVKKASDIKELMDLIEVGNYKEVIEYDFSSMMNIYDVWVDGK